MAGILLNPFIVKAFVISGTAPSAPTATLTNTYDQATQVTSKFGHEHWGRFCDYSITPPADNGGNALTKYTVWYGPDGGGPTRITDLSPSATTFTIQVGSWIPYYSQPPAGAPSVNLSLTATNIAGTSPRSTILNQRAHSVYWTQQRTVGASTTTTGLGASYNGLPLRWHIYEYGTDTLIETTAYDDMLSIPYTYTYPNSETRLLYAVGESALGVTTSAGSLALSGGRTQVFTASTSAPTGTPTLTWLGESSYVTGTKWGSTTHYQQDYQISYTYTNFNADRLNGNSLFNVYLDGAGVSNIWASQSEVGNPSSWLFSVETASGYNGHVTVKPYNTFGIGTVSNTA